MSGPPTTYGEYVTKGNLRLHLVGLLGGFIWCFGMTMSLIASGGDPAKLLEAFVRTANQYKGQIGLLEIYWQAAVSLAESGQIPFSVDEMREAIREIKKLTDKPFGVDLLLPSNIVGGGDPPESAIKEMPLSELLKTLPKAHYEWLMKTKDEMNLPDVELMVGLNAQPNEFAMLTRLATVARAEGSTRSMTNVW